MKKFLFIIIIIYIHTSLFSQEQLKFSKNKYNAGSDAANSLILGSLLILTPTLIIDDSKSYFGLSKELSIGKFPYGRAELDYTFIFRNERNSMLNISYNNDIPLNGNFSNPSLFMISPGAGYYTDFTNKGYFVQAEIGLWASTGFMENLSIHPSLKFRYIFKNENIRQIFSVSLGVGFGIYSR